MAGGSVSKKTGRPTKCTPEALAAAEKYLANCEKKGIVTTVPDLARAVGIARSRVYVWAEQDRGGFEDILERCNRAQESALIHKGLSGEYNSNIVKLMLGKHGYHSESKMGLTGGDGGPIKTENKWIVEGVRPNATPPDS